MDWWWSIRTPATSSVGGGSGNKQTGSGTNIPGPLGPQVIMVDLVMDYPGHGESGAGATGVMGTQGCRKWW